MAVSTLTSAARRHIAKMLVAIRRAAPQLDRQFAALLRELPYDDGQIAAFQGIAPAAAARAASLRQFLEQVDRNGRILAQRNVPPAEVEERLRESGGLLNALLGDKFQPAREQLELISILTLRQAFYEVREAESQAFFGMYCAETEAANLEERLHRMVRILARTFQARAGRLVLHGGNAKLARPLYIERGRPGEVLIADGEMRGQYASYWSYPLTPGGVVQFGFSAKRRWLPRELSLLEWVARRCHEASEQEGLAAEVRRLEAQSREAEQAERRRIGRELHDEAGQSLLFLRLHLEMLEREAPPLLREKLAEARGVTTRIVTELRRIIAALSPDVLDRLGLERALRHLGSRFRKLHPARVRMEIARCEGVSPEVQEVIYRVSQESLQNIAKHSGAGRVNLCLRPADHFVRLSVTDDGAGFNAEKTAGKPMSFGLAGMRERARLLGGTLVLRSAPGKGTSVILQVPRNSAWEAPNGQNSHSSC